MTKNPTAIVVAFVLVFGTSHVIASPQGIATGSSDGDWMVPGQMALQRMPLAT